MEPKEPANPDANNPSGNPAEPAAPAPAAPASPEPAKPAEPAAPAEPRSNSPDPKLQSQKDKLQHRVNTLESVLEPIAMERMADAFIEGNKEKFPDITREDLLDAPDFSDDGLTKYATRLQTRLQEHAQNALHKIENPEVPKMTLDEKNAELEKLRADPKKRGRFGTYLGLLQKA